MNRVVKHSLKLFCLAALVACAQAPALAQQALAQPRSRLQIDDLDRLAPRAEHVVDVTIPESLLGLIPRMLAKSNDPEAAKVADIARGFKGVYVRVFEFAEAGRWGESDIAGLRAQLKQPGWERIVSVRSRKDGQNVEVYLMSDPANLGGLAVIATEPDQLTVVNIVGKIDIEKLAALEGHLGIPDLDIHIGGGDDDDRDRDEDGGRKPRRTTPATTPVTTPAATRATKPAVKKP
jgi:hypothetical protein